MEGGGAAGGLAAYAAGRARRGGRQDSDGTSPRLRGYGYLQRFRLGGARGKLPRHPRRRDADGRRGARRALARALPPVRAVVGHERRQEQVYTYNSAQPEPLPLCRSGLFTGLISRRLPRQPHFRREEFHSRRKLRQRAAASQGCEGGRPLGHADRPHHPACQLGAYPLEAHRPDGRLERETPGSG